MIDTSNYVRFERVDSFERIEHGLLARLHGEQLRIEVVGDVGWVTVDENIIGPEAGSTVTVVVNP